MYNGYFLTVINNFLIRARLIGYPFVVICLLLLPACGGVKRPMNLTIAKEHVEYYYECGQYDKDLDKAVDGAMKHFAKIPVTSNATVIFDIDDTVLSDYADSKAISFGYIPKLFHEWILRSDAPKIKQTKKLYDYLVHRGFKIIFLTGRKHDEYEPTIKNLRAQGFTQFDMLIVRKLKEEPMLAKEYKSRERAKLAKKGYTIVGSVGDQWSDLTGGHNGLTVKLPNYRYCIY